MRATAADLCDLEAANARFVAEARAHDLRFRCEHCAHAHRAGNACSMGYPNHFLQGPPRAVMPDGALAFCKYFELGEEREI